MTTELPGASPVERPVSRLVISRADGCTQGCNGCDKCTDYDDDPDHPGDQCDHAAHNEILAQRRKFTMFKTVSLPAETWVKIVRRLTAEVGADDDSRVLAGAIKEQTSGAVKVRATGNSVQFKAGKGGDLRGKAGPLPERGWD